MSEIADFLRARYAEARDRENGKRRSIPSPFDGRDVVWQSDAEGERLLVDGHPFPVDRYLEAATEPAPHPAVLADLDAKLAIVDLHGGWHRCPTYDQYPGVPRFVDGDPRTQTEPCSTLRVLAQIFAGHPDHKGEEWAP